jgi:hypothetical protein
LGQRWVQAELCADIERFHEILHLLTTWQVLHSLRYGSSKPLDEPVGESGVDKPLIGILYLWWHFLLDREAAFGVLGDALGITDEHVDDALGVTDIFDVLVQWQWARGTEDFDFGPDFLAGGEGASLLVWPGDKQDRTYVDVFVNEHSAGELDVLAGVGGCGLDSDGPGWHAEFDCVVPVVDSLAAGKPVDRRWCICAGENDEWEHCAMEQLGDIDGHARVMAAQPDADIARVQVVVHVMVIPEEFNV